MNGEFKKERLLVTLIVIGSVFSLMTVIWFTWFCCSTTLENQKLAASELTIRNLRSRLARSHQTMNAAISVRAAGGDQEWAAELDRARALLDGDMALLAQLTSVSDTDRMRIDHAIASFDTVSDSILQIVIDDGPDKAVEKWLAPDALTQKQQLRRALTTAVHYCDKSIQSVQDAQNKRVGQVIAASVGSNVILTLMLLVGIGRIRNHVFRQALIERTLKTQVVDLTELRRLAESASEAKSNFLASTSHELRTPLTTILGYADQLYENLPADKEREVVDIIRQRGSGLLQLINDLLDLARIESGKNVLEPSLASPWKIASEVTNMLRVRADAKSLVLETRCNGPIPREIRTDPLRLEQILLNLVNNAVKFTDEGHVRTTLSYAYDARELRVVVEDSGHGIPDDCVDKLFVPFARGAANRSQEGTGLGLAISRQLADLLNGTISVNSKLGTGSEFMLTLPVGESVPVDLYTPEPHVDQDVIEEILRRLESGETLQQYPARLRCKDGSIRLVEINSNVYREDGHFEHTRCFTTDVTDSRRREAALIASEKKLKAISDAALDAVVTADAENRVAHWNPAAERMFGYSTEEIVDQRVQDVLTPERFRECADAGWPTFSSSGSGPIAGEIRELTGLRKDGSEFPIELSVSGFPLDGRWWTVAIVRDTTDRNSAEQRLTKALREAQAANNAKSEFLAVVSHEMRTPLNSILGTLDLTMQTSLGNDQQKMLDMCLQSGTQLKALIDDVLDYSQFQAGGFSLQSQVMELPEILERIRETFGPRSQDKGLDFRWHVDPEIPTLLWGDGGRLYQVIDNLLNNAVKFTNAGYVAFRAELEKSNEGGATLSFTIEDSGIGIPSEHRTRMFQRFEQVDSGATRVFGGVGLGLSICDKLVDLMGGEIRCEGVAGGGSRFVFNAEFANPTRQQIKEIRRRPSEYSEPKISFREVHVLLAEDDPASCVVTKRMLENAGVVVTTVTDGRQVVEEFRQNPNRFSAVFMDMMMPFLDGIEATRQIRELQQTKIPVIAMTAKAMDGDREQILNSGLDAYLSKPVERIELLRTLRRVIGKSKDQVPSDQKSSAEQRTEILDSVALRRRCNDDVELLSEISELFGTTCDDAIRVIEESIDSNDLSGVVRAAHLLKGSVTNMCARQALEVSEQFELAARRSDLDGVNNLMTELKSEIHSLRQALEVFLNER